MPVLHLDEETTGRACSSPQVTEVRTEPGKLCTASLLEKWGLAGLGRPRENTVFTLKSPWVITSPKERESQGAEDRFRASHSVYL